MAYDFQAILKAYPDATSIEDNVGAWKADGTQITLVQSDIDAVNEVLKSDWLTQGPTVPLFEEKVAEYCGSNFSIATNSATSALHVACLALDLTKGDLLWTCPNTFVASSNAALYCGAKVDFIDCNKDTYNIDVEKLETKLQKA